ncbi:hypothetical protein B0H19DRAFT_301230 [Mycena capillaripes]|nr:hypothetical protein B0H19DRAFT_301230 [Mycena capillaripes]
MKHLRRTRLTGCLSCSLPCSIMSHCRRMCSFQPLSTTNIFSVQVRFTTCLALSAHTDNNSCTVVSDACAALVGHRQPSFQCIKSHHLCTCLQLSTCT